MADAHDYTSNGRVILRGNNDLSSKFKNTMTDTCSVKTLNKRLPILTWLPTYQFSWLPGDIIAGFSVALVIFPHSLAAGIIAGLTAPYGLYAAFMGGFVYLFLGPTRKLNIGPTYIMALMTLYYSNLGGPGYAALLCFLVGIVEFIAGFINFGFLINYISIPVISGYTNAAGVTIILAQLRRMFGPPVKSHTFFDILYQMYLHITDCKWQDLVLYVFCTATLIFLKELRTMKWPYLKRGPMILRTIVSKTIYYLSEGRNVWIITFGVVMVLQMGPENQPFTLTGTVPVGIPPVKAPSFSATIDDVTMSFMDILGDMWLGVIMITLVAIVDDVLVAKAYAEGNKVDLPQEISTLGIINIFASFFGSFPATASLHRSWVNDTSGARTPVCGLFTGLAVLFINIALATHYVSFCPISNSVGIITCGAYILLDFDNPIPMWRSRKPDFALFIVSFTACLALGLHYGILVGIAANLSMMLLSIATPSVYVTTEKCAETGFQYVLVTPSNDVHYPSATHIMSRIIKAGTREAEGKFPVVVNCSGIHTIDYTTAKKFKETVAQFEKRDQTLVFLNILPKVFETIKPLKEITTCESMADVVALLCHPPNTASIQL